MIFGNDYWDIEIVSDLTSKTFNKREYYTFKNSKENMYQIIRDNALESPEKIGLVDTNGKFYNYREILEMTDQLSSYFLDKYNIVNGKHIGLLLFNSVEFIISFLAAQKLGAVIIPFPTKYKEPEICSLIDKSDCDLLITDEKYYPWVMKNYQHSDLSVLVCESKDETHEYAFQFLNNYNLVDVEENGSIEDVAMILFTSGTTSHSKGVVIKNYNVQHAITTYSKVLDVSDRDSTILSIPIYNVTGLVATLSLFLKCRGTIYIHKFFDAKKLLADIHKYNITFFHASPTIFNLMLKEKNAFTSLPSLKTLACGSSNMSERKIKELKQWLPQMSFRTIYGLSESTSPATIFPSDASVSNNIGSSGQPIPGLMLKIVNDSGNEVNNGEIGEILMKGTNVIDEYYQQDTGLITDNFWLKTGDIGYINQEGYLYVVDRKKDLINRGGEKIFSFDIENAIYKIEGINEVAVVGVKDHIYGEVPIAVISMKEGYRLEESEIKSKLKKQLASYEVPIAYYFVDQICKTANGKIDKKRLRSIFAIERREISEY